ncbi:oxaloacetate decarboxylase, gamma chain [Clostridium tepidiprofundi DSM 19306]|uniref:Oxaloacetate decarboxylase, gamma chain n=1 Tax=Clostridium tepidiprofundi DSM 19306 TaxID=1121338 RepID=A0A151B3P6_9CLOT|nr:OadG family protein [Clostridium tepidiprofundi]KYH34382.1 oxaloacetate decarboxylase, gamma chain [Clostridium tepidiprofundi DSM 19306]
MTFMGALNVTIVSMVIVFSLLAFLMGIIYLQTYLIKVLPIVWNKIVSIFKSIFKSKNHKQVRNDEFNDISNEGDSVVSDDCDSNISSNDELEIVAAIMAAISEYTDIPEQRLVIKSIKRVNSNNSRWVNADLF